jgi:hypothetical protein
MYNHASIRTTNEKNITFKKNKNQLIKLDQNERENVFAELYLL